MKTLTTVPRMTEKQEQAQLIKYVQLQYPTAVYRIDKDGVRMGWKQIKTQAEEKSSRGFPDIIIRNKRKGFNGLVIEFKRTGENPFKKDGELKKDDHLVEQKEWLDWFSDCGMKAQFSVGFEATKQLIDWYFT